MSELFYYGAVAGAADGEDIGVGIGVVDVVDVDGEDIGVGIGVVDVVDVDGEDVGVGYEHSQLMPSDRHLPPEQNLFPS